MQQERDFSYKGLSKDAKIRHIVRFVSNLWQIHPFGEGNTRATAVFIIKYLYTLGFVTNNDMFKEHAKYFRNALVRANYQNLANDIPYTMEFLNKFFGNLLLGEKNLLDNREMQIKSEKSSQKSSQKTTQKTTQKSSQKILALVAQNPRVTTTEMAEILGISRRAIAKQITALKETGKLRRIGPDKGGHWEVLEEN